LVELALTVEASPWRIFLIYLLANSGVIFSDCILLYVPSLESLFKISRIDFVLKKKNPDVAVVKSFTGANFRDHSSVLSKTRTSPELIEK
jgi:hypothetical protein